MAIYHFYLKNGKQGSAKLHCDYIFREGRYGSGKMKEELVHKESGNLPFWAKSASDFFDCADVFERANGNAYSEFEVGLQAELSLEENVGLVKKLINEHIGNKKVWAFAIHEKMATLEENQRQPHAHIMFCERMITDDSEQVKYPSNFFKRYNDQTPENGGYLKDNRFTQNKNISGTNLARVREFWERINNEALSRNGLDVRISCKSLEAQRQDALANNDELLAESLDRPVQPHLGPRLAAQMSRALQRDNFNIEMLSIKGQLVYEAKMIKRIKEQIRERKQFAKKLQDEKNLQQEVVQDFDTQSITIYGKELVQKIGKLDAKWGNHFTFNQDKINKLRKDVVSDKGLENIALSIFTKGMSTELNKFRRKIESQKEAFNLAAEKFNQMPTPKFWQSDAKVEYKLEKEKLDSWRRELSDEAVKFKKWQQAFDAELAKPDNKERLEKLRGKLRVQRASAQKFITEIEKENRKITNYRLQLRKMNKIINRKGKYTVDEGVMLVLEKGNLSNVVQAIKKLKQVVMADVEPGHNLKNNMRINLHGRDRERNSGYDIGI